MTRLPVLAMLTAAMLVPLLVPRLPAAQAPGSSSTVEIEYLANEGVLVTSGTAMILIDGLMGDGLPGYPIASPAVRDSLEHALGRFRAIRLVLVTHVHRDHFDAQAVAAHLHANPGAVVAGSSQVADSLAILAGWTDRTRVWTLPAATGGVDRMVLPGVTVESHGIPHPPSRNQPVEHLVWVVELGGRRILHLGDSSPSPVELAAVAGAGVDALLAPFWVLGGSDGQERIAATRASRVAAFHFGRDSRPFVGDPSIIPLRSLGQLIHLP